MAIAFTLLFDDELERVLAEATKGLFDAFGGMDLLGRRMRPHVTLGIFDDLALDAALPVIRACLPSEPQRVQLASVGAFGAPAGVVFLAPIVRPTLLDLHARVHAAVGPHASNGWPHYAPGQWVPHVTLAHDVDASDVAPILVRARDLPLPLHGWMDGLWVIDADMDVNEPVTTRAQVPFERPGRARHACIGIGSNLDPVRHVAEGLRALAKDAGTLWVGDVVHTEPVEMETPHGFVNTVVWLPTTRDDPSLKAWLNDLEQQMGRDRSHPQRSAMDRPIDFDVLWSGTAPVPPEALCPAQTPYFASVYRRLRAALAGKPLPADDTLRRVELRVEGRRVGMHPTAVDANRDARDE